MGHGNRHRITEALTELYLDATHQLRAPRRIPYQLGRGKVELVAEAGVVCVDGVLTDLVLRNVWQLALITQCFWRSCAQMDVRVQGGAMPRNAGILQGGAAERQREAHRIVEGHAQGDEGCALKDEVQFAIWPLLEVGRGRTIHARELDWHIRELGIAAHQRQQRRIEEAEGEIEVGNLTGGQIQVTGGDHVTIV